MTISLETSTSSDPKSRSSHVREAERLRLLAIDIGKPVFYGELRRHNYLAGPAKRRWILKERRNRATDELGTFRVAQIEDTCGQHRLGSDKTWVH